MLSQVSPHCATTASAGGWWFRLIVMVALVVWSGWVYSLVTGQFTRAYRARTTRERWLMVLRTVGLAYLVVVPMGLAAAVEHRDIADLLFSSKQSWALRGGDMLLIELLAGACAFIWIQLASRPGWYHIRVIPFVALLLGVAWAIVFRTDEGRVYDRWRFWSLGKIAHDFVNVPVITALLVMALISAIAALWAHPNWPTVLAGVGVLVAIVAFGLLLRHDRTGLDPRFLHVKDYWGWWPRVVHCGA
jgi:hypothetical protein